MKGRHGAAHFAAFPRPPNYRNRNTNAHTNNKEKKLKKILASVFLVLAVIAAVGVFGLQTSNQAEAQGVGAVVMNTGVNSGNGVPDLNIVAGRTYVIDLSEFVTESDDATASTTYHIITTRDYIYDFDSDDADNTATDPPLISDNPGNPTRLNGAFRSQCAPGATTCADSAGPVFFISLDENTGLLTIRGNPDRGGGVFGVGAGSLIQWVADSTPANNGNAAAAITAITQYDTHSTLSPAGDGSDPDTFRIGMVAPLTSGVTPARGSDVPTTLFPTQSQRDSTTPYDEPSWRSGATATIVDDAAMTVLSAPAKSAATSAGEVGSQVVWVLEDLPTVPVAYEMVAHSSDTDVVATPEVSGSVVTLTPKSVGTATITLDIIPPTFATGSSLRARTAITDKWRITREFTVTHSAEAPPIEIYRDRNGNGKDSDDPTGDTKAAPIVIPVASGASGEIARLRTDSSGTATYQNRNIFWGLAPGNGADVVQNFRITNGGLSNNPTDLGADNAVGGTGVNLDTTSQVSTGILSTAPGVTLPAGSTYNIQVTADDTAPGGTIDNAYITVTIIQGNRPPVLTTPLEITVPESPGTAVGAMIFDLDTLSSDPDGQNITFDLVDKAGQTPEENLVSGGKFTIHAATNELRLAEAIDYEDVDGDGNIAEEDTAEERTTLGFDRDAVRWRGTITATDGLVTTERKIAIKVGDGPEAPTVAPTSGIEFRVAENSLAGTVIGTVELPSDTTGGDDVSTGLMVHNTVHGGIATGQTGTDAAARWFAIDESDGELTVQHAGLDYEKPTSANRHQILVSAADAETTIVTVIITDVNEAPEFGFGDNPNPDNVSVYVATISEAAAVGSPVAAGAAQDDNTDGSARANVFVAEDEDAGDVLSYSLVAAQTTAGNPITSPEVAYSGPFTINASTGAITVSASLDAETVDEHVMYVKATDDDATTPLSDTVKLTITVSNANEPPIFVTTSDGTTEKTETSPVALDEDSGAAAFSAQNPRPLPGANATATQLANAAIATYYGWDSDGDDVNFVLRTSDDANFFSIRTLKTGTGRATGYLLPAAARTLDYENQVSYELEIEVTDSIVQNQTEQTINLNNLNDNAPVWQDGYTAASPVNNQLSVNENTQRGHLLATYLATDADGDPITYTLSGPDGSGYQIGSADGMLKTLKALDAESDITDRLTITATDNPTDRTATRRSVTRNAGITINGVDDRIGSITVKMANPVLGTHGDPNTALVDRKTTLSSAVPEAPADLPAIRGAETGSAPVEKFVETADASWGTVLRIEVTAQSPDSSTLSAGGERCGNGNQCVVLTLEGDDSDDTLKVMAYRSNEADNLFIAAVMPVQNTGEATNVTGAVYKHRDGSVPRIKVDEEDTLIIKFGNLRDRIRIDNEAPEFSNFLPEHEDSTDDEEVEYTFTVTDDISGIPDPEDLPDNDGDDAYMAVVALVNTQQCHNVNVADGATPPSGTTMVPDTNLYGGAQIYCPSATTPRERVINDDKDLDSVTNGYEVTTEVVLNENEISYVTFIACDAAGNCTAFDPDENDNAEALAEITVDTIEPDLTQARTGVMWDAADNKYDDSRSFIQAIFTDLSKLNPDTIEADDFVVDGYTIKRVYWYDDPDTEDQNWGTRFDTGSGSRAYREISKTVFIELEEELLPDATPDVSVVPNGLEDEAGKEQDDDEVEADDWIAPKFAVQSITSPRETSRDNVLVGEDEKVTLTVTSDERISTTKPLVDVDYVNAPAGCVDRSGIILRAGRDTDGDGRLEPGEARADCAVNAKGTPLNSVISKDGTNEWTITVDKPSATGYYNVYIYADDRSSQNNRGSEGVAPADLVTKFFEKDGDVNADDAVFFEGDVQLPKPQVVVSGEDAGDTEPTVEFKRPLFIEVDFTEPFSADCSAGDKLSNKLECTAESAEYAQDGFDAVTITRFELDGVDMTDDVKTTDDETFLIALDDVGIGDHELKIQATDLAGNELKDVLEIEFEVEERDPFTRRLNPGWNLVSLPGSPADSAIASVFDSDIEVRTVYTYNPVTPGGWQVAVRETLDDAWQGDLTDITAKSGYWVLSDAIQDLEVSIPRLAGGAVGASTPVQPPVIPMYAGWNLIPVVDVTGDALDTKKSINATTYLNSLDDGLDLARVLGFNTITNEWFTVIDPSDASVTDNLQIGSAYWVFVRESASLVPGGIPR